MDSVDELEFRPGTDDVHVDISDTRVGVRNGCSDW
jgi:hypothetical protein